MCAWVPIAIAAAQAVGGGISAYHQTKSENKMADFRAASSRENAKAARYEAQNSRLEYERAATAKRKEKAAQLGAYRSAMGASGVAVDSGSVMDVMLSLAEEGQREISGVLQQGEMEFWRHMDRARSYTNEAIYNEAQKRKPRSVFWGSMLTGGSNVAMMAAQTYAKR